MGGGVAVVIFLARLGEGAAALKRGSAEKGDAEVGVV